MFTTIKPMAFALLLCMAASLSAAAEIPEGSEDTNLESIDYLNGEKRLPGVLLSEGISQVTGVAISPLLGVSGVGAWQYFRTPEDLRDQLPWFCHPIAWSVGAGILLLCFLKDTFGTALPAFLKKPFDVVEVFEDKLSAILAGSTVVPFTAKQIANQLSNPVLEPTSALVQVENGTLASAVPSILGQTGYNFVVIPLLLLGFGVVWLLSHALTVLILLSPFPALDALLKSIRLGFLAFLTIVSLINPLIGAILCLGIIAIAAWLAPRAFRLCFFGSVMSIDFLGSLVVKSKTKKETKGFLARHDNDKIPVRAYGRLRTEEDGSVTFHSRRFFFGPTRSVSLPSPLVIQKGLLFPSIVTTKAAGTGNHEVVHLLPKYRHHTERVATILGVSEVLDPVAIRGLKAMKSWLQSLRQSSHREPTSSPS